MLCSERSDRLCFSRSGSLTLLVGFRYLLGTLDVWPFPNEAPLQVHPLTSPCHSLPVLKQLVRLARILS